MELELGDDGKWTTELGNELVINWKCKNSFCVAKMKQEYREVGH